MLVLAGTQCGTHDSREGDTERPVSFGMMVEPSVQADFQWGVRVLSLYKIALLAEITMVGR